MRNQSFSILAFLQIRLRTFRASVLYEKSIPTLPCINNSERSDLYLKTEVDFYWLKTPKMLNVK